MAQRTFIRITNKDIYEKLCNIERSIGRLKATTTWHTWAIGVLLAIELVLIKAVI